MRNVCLRGITWNHSRALPPLVAAAQRFEEIHPEVRIIWEKRSLDEFGHTSLSGLAHSYDLLIIDHPMLGEVHRDRVLLDLHARLSLKTSNELMDEALGLSLESYRYEGCLYALPVDAAAPAASYRPDLLSGGGYQVPTEWGQVTDLARRRQVRMPGFPADIFLNLMGMCASRGSAVAVGDCLFDHEIAKRCLEELRELASFMPEEIYAMNPIAIYEAMAAGDEFSYCPFAYTYSNYSRQGFAANIVSFANPVRLPDGTALRTILGGTGIAVSSKCVHTAAAVDFCVFVSGSNCQTHLYGVCGGQPACASAWHDPLLNQVSGSFFGRTLASLENAVMRPRYPGYIGLQGSGGQAIIEYLRNQTTAANALQRIDVLYRESLLKLENALEATA